MEFNTWFESEWRREGETDTTALTRLSVESGVSTKTLFYARKGARQTAETARTLVAFTNGKVDGWSLITGPHRDDLKSSGSEAA